MNLNAWAQESTAPYIHALEPGCTNHASFSILWSTIEMSFQPGSFVTLVSGLPRSGTSMMMQMLHAGGIPAVTDNIRLADKDNERGYYELEAVKRTKDDASWLRDAPGKAVKVIYLLLYDLPTDYTYRVIFMNRNLDEVLASQRAMLERRRAKRSQCVPGRDAAHILKPVGKGP